MFKSEVLESDSTLDPTLDVFHTNSTTTGVQTARYTENSLVSGLDITPYEFRLLGNPAFIDLRRSFIITKYKIVDEKGDDITEEDETKHLYAPGNLIGCTQFKEVQFYVNGKLCYDIDNFPHQCYMTALLSYNKEYKETFLRAAGFSNESSPESKTDAEYLKRVKACAKSKPMEAITPLWFEPATQGKALPSYCDIRILCYPAADSQRIDVRLGGRKYKMKILGMSLITRELLLADATLVAFDSLLRTRGSITYSSLATNVRTVYIPPNIRSFPAFRVFSSSIPRRIFFALVEASAFNGNFTNPFVFKPFALQNVRVEAGGEVLPFTDWHLDYENNIFMRAYLSLAEGLSVAGTGISNGISPAAFASTKCIYCFDTSGAMGDSFALQRVGETTVSLTFASLTPSSGLMAIFLGESVTNLTIDSDRNATVY